MATRNPANVIAWGTWNYGATMTSFTVTADADVSGEVNPGEEMEKVMEALTQHGTWMGLSDHATGGTVFMKPGSKGGVQQGMKFSVYRPGEALIDPDTGLSLGSEESKIGEIEYLSDVADGKAGKAIVKSGTGMQTGDLVRIK